MEIKVRTLTDRIYDNLFPIIIVSVVAIFVLIMSIVSHNNAADREAFEKNQAYKSKQHETFKVNAIKTSKPTLICNGENILLPTEYDMVNIKYTNFIITEEAKPLFQNSYKLSECEVYSHVTETMKPKPIIPMDKKMQTVIDMRDKTIGNLSTSINTYKVSNANYTTALEEANNIITELKELVETQKDTIHDLAITEAKYLEVKELLTIVLEKRDINIADLVVKEKPIKIVKIDIKKIVEKVIPIKVVAVKPVTNNLSPKEYAKRIIFAIKTINEKHKDPSLVFNGPTQKELDNITINEKSLENIEYSDNLLKSLRIRIGIYSRMFKYNKVEVRNRIRTSIGV